MRLLEVRRGPIILVALAAGLGCDGVTLPEVGDHPLLQTDRYEYVLVEDGAPFTTEIPYTFHNTTGRTVSLVNCNGYIQPGLQKWDAGEWVHGWSPMELLCLSAPVEIAPGEVFEDTLRVFAYRYGGRAYPQFATPDPEGTYRLVWSRAHFDYAPDSGNGHPLPAGPPVSNPFRLRVE
jgi:hypothetical protein